MPPDDRALARSIALVPAEGREAARPVAEAEARLRAVLAEVTALDGELEALSAALAAFSHAWEHAVGASFAGLAAAERVVGKLRRLEEGLLALADALAAGSPPPPAREPAGRRARGRSRPSASGAAREATREDDGEPEVASAPAGGEDDRGAEPPPEIEAEERVLKRLYRRLARVLHPDLARDPAEAARLSELMARVNAAYAKGDRTALEVMAERVGAGEPPGELTDEERLAHLERRIATLARIAASLGRERDRLVRSDTHRLRAEAERRAAEGGVLVAETRAGVEEEAAAARADALARLDRVAAAARALARARRTAMREIEKRGPTGARRAFDPLAESDLVRRSAARLERRRATAEARALARTLEDAARAAPWEVALTCLAFFAEDAGGRPPEALASAEGLAARWDRIRAAWPAAPDLPRALGRLPRHLALGARAEGDAVQAGLQLASAELAAGVRIALDATPVAAIARDVLAALGPEETCKACGAAGPALHLHRTRGLDTLHGLACAACGAILRSYWRYGEVDGLEALAPHALRLGLIAEVTAALGDTALGFQMLPAEAEALTAGRLRRRFSELYLAPYDVGVAPEAVAVVADDGPLGDGARVAGRAGLQLRVAADAGTTADGLLELLRARIERRFRP
ncbi:J domain-containing protein [Anaeromyxobacter oryzisoli]|uniref:J domain-containing protein n=1 Tax=Anaeromyxobacter oryzisoli TaxID=2925408 RepID=UPI001F5AD465|nr:J domain-containing protein [Anaeromyxobacter sp. SG63]